MTDYERIQQRLFQEASAGPYYAISTDTETKLKTVDTLVAISPASVHVEEDTTSFGNPRLNRRSARSERLTWRWRVAVRFNIEAATHDFEKRMIATWIILPRDAANGLEQITLKLLDSDPFHPPQQNPTSGTQVTFTFEAETAPV